MKREKNDYNLPVCSQVVSELLGVLGGELLRATDRGELRPPEAVGAEAVAVLSLCGEEQNSLTVLVLHSLDLIMFAH